MLIERIDTDYVHMTNAQVAVEKYTDSTLALMASDVDENGYPDDETFSVNLTAYGFEPEDGCVFIKDDSEHLGLAKALADLGLGEVISTFYYGPFRVRAHEFKLADTLLEEVR